MNIDRREFLNRILVWTVQIQFLFSLLLGIGMLL